MLHLQYDRCNFNCCTTASLLAINKRFSGNIQFMRTLIPLEFSNKMANMAGNFIQHSTAPLFPFSALMMLVGRQEGHPGDSGQ